MHEFLSTYRELLESVEWDVSLGFVMLYSSYVGQLGRAGESTCDLCRLDLHSNLDVFLSFFL